MTDAYNVLFICTSNSARSIMAEGLLNGLGHGKFVAYSGGSQPKDEVHPLAIETLEHMGIAASAYRSKDWNEFAAPDAPQFDFIFTVCDDAAGETCPVWPGNPATAHWGVADPAAVEGSHEDKHKAFHDAAIVLKRRLELFMALPLARLDALALHHELHGIGNS